MLKKEDRADKTTLEKVFKKGFFIGSTNLSFRYLKSNKTKISFVAPKSVAKTAVMRNSLRRLGYDALKNQLKSTPFPVYGVFVFKNKDISNISNEIKTIFSKIN